MTKPNIIENVSKNNTIGINFQTTKKCNFNCSYCYEVGQHRDESSEINTLPDVFRLIDTINLDTDKTFDLTFIGGEPTLNADYATPIINYIYRAGLLNSVTLITNGWSAELIGTFFGEAPKELINVQVSYDGRDINDKFRKMQGKFTTELVLDNLGSLITSGFKVNLKSTLPIDALHTVPKIIREFRELSIKYGTDLRYSPTEDFTTTFKNTREFEDFKDYLDSSFQEILREELIGLEQGLPACSRWFNSYDFESKPQCNAGVSFFTINEDGNVQYCHHVDYTKDAGVLNITNISDKDIWDKMKKYSIRTQKLIDNQSDECSGCTALYCIKCPIINFSITKDKEKMHGKHAIPFMCNYYQELSKYIYAYDKIKKEK